MTRNATTVTARIVNGFVTLQDNGDPELLKAGRDGLSDEDLARLGTGAAGRPQAIGGNPAGVVLDADGLSDAQMLEIAQMVGLSETAFVSRSETEGFKLDFFTPTRRIAHCGHATIATFSYLAELGRVGEGGTSKETVDGPRKIIIRDGAAYMEQLAPRYEDPSDWADRGVQEQDVLAALGLAPEYLDPRFAPMLANTGNSFVLVAVKDAAALRAVKPELSRIDAISEALDLIGFYVFTTDPEATSADATARMFAPRYGISEESATGMAAGPLACALYDHLGVRRPKLLIEQGHFMEPASPSEITVELNLDAGRITGLMAGGYGAVMKELQIRLDHSPAPAAGKSND
ncbi:PhzF family phenazine biosynthesis protein [Leisingera sp. McT4-56]|uniref:PhzF family phenazine biosynthesis protein n=1 Tax=Leisingera sp. McT4-56 TaxID=2881255 RepID=UPI001CF8E43C|nr:PhzF family phenazine biosynthesis protein [Leisingera sp. McT4-56]MCB4457358.1 PhzF family phenazine biosynthesis protein [Leisingera sp. McT4-56]